MAVLTTGQYCHDYQSESGDGEGEILGSNEGQNMAFEAFQIAVCKIVSLPLLTAVWSPLVQRL